MTQTRFKPLSLDQMSPDQRHIERIQQSIDSYGWQQHCHGLFQTPIAA